MIDGIIRSNVTSASVSSDTKEMHNIDTPSATPTNSRSAMKLKDLYDIIDGDEDQNIIKSPQFGVN
jgi:hypothetical protein